MYNTYIQLHTPKRKATMAISKQEIIDAAEKLAAEGVNPSMQAVRDRLGGGSFATISPVLREWKENREATTVAVLEMPSDVKGALDRFGADLWKTASALATAQFEKLKDDTRNSVEAAKKERDEALEEIQRLETLILEHDNHMSSVNAEVERMNNLLDDERKKNAALQQRNDDLQETVAGLKSDLKESREDGKQTLSKLDALRQEQTELSRMNGQLTAEVEALGKELVAMTNARNEVKAENARISDSLATLQKEKDFIESEKAKAVEQAEIAKDKLDLLRQEQAELSRNNGQLTTKVEALDKELMAMTEARNDSKAECVQLSDSLAAIQRAKEKIESEKAKVVEQAEVTKAEMAGLLALNGEYKTQIDDLKAQLAGALSSEKKQTLRSGNKKTQPKPKPEEK